MLPSKLFRTYSRGMPNQQQQAALGAVIGSLVGDAAGATLEFAGKGYWRDKFFRRLQSSMPQPKDPLESGRISQEAVKWALSMPGGGIHAVAPGQITDDGELTLCLLQGLAKRVRGEASLQEHEDPSFFWKEYPAMNYALWLASVPFDIGNTTRIAIEGSLDLQRIKAPLSKRMYMSTDVGSAANGSLMRCIPIAVFGHRMTDAEIATIGEHDSALTHSNPVCTIAVAAYCIAAAHLIRTAGDESVNRPVAAWTRASEWIVSERQQCEPASPRGQALSDVHSWLAYANTEAPIPFGPLEGFVKIAFTHAFRHLLLGSSFEHALSETLRGGGDTDTNACIVGGLVGCARQLNDIDGFYVNKVLGSDLSLGKHPRPDWLRPHDIEGLVQNVLAHAPKSLPR
mmetsp:Transcript_27323/g.64854  ORF Transcript_27323/g.64854 Transcript_27323/m.64854 type:complete len:399 (-) Transcript_27323:25-1221(-)